MTATLIFTNVALLLMCAVMAHALHEIKGLKLAVGYLLGKVQKAAGQGGEHDDKDVGNMQ